MEKYVPDIYQKSIYDINYSLLKEKGIKCLIFNLDNTVVPHDEQHVTKKIEDLFNELKKDFNIIVFSNVKRTKVNYFAVSLQVYGLTSFKLKNVKCLEKVLSKYKLDETQIAIIGNQLNTDIALGNKAGITTILINPISKREVFWKKLGRIQERRIMKRLKDHDLFFKGRYYE